MIGSIIGAYVVERELGRGGMGVVYAARHTGLHQRVAVKVLLPELGGDPALLDRFFGEAQAAAASRHPGIVQIVDVNRRDERPYIVMEFLEGESLAARLARTPRLPIADVVALARQLFSALSAAHAAGVVHRDLKPDNVQVVPDPDMPRGERAKILDFGIAKIASYLAGRGGPTRTGVVIGTPSYMSPEQCRGSAAVDHRSDLYSVGCIVFEMLAGHPPFPGEIGEVIGAHQYRPPPAVRLQRSDVPGRLDRLVAGLLAKDPAERPRSAAAMVTALDDLALRVKDTTSARTPADESTRARPRHTTMSAASGESPAPLAVSQRWPRVAAVGGLVAVAVVALAVTMPGREDGEADRRTVAGVGATAAPSRIVEWRSEATAASAPIAPATSVAPAPTKVTPEMTAASTVGPGSRTLPEQRAAKRAANRPGAKTALPAPPVTTPAPTVEPVPGGTPSDTVSSGDLTPIELAEQRARRGDWAGAMQLALGVLRVEPDEPRALVVAALAGCNTQSPSVAQVIIPRLAARVARNVRQVCAARGFLLAAPTQAPAPAPPTVEPTQE